MSFRSARRSDLRDVVSLLHDDILGKTREKLTTVDSGLYEKAFEEILQDRNNDLLILEEQGEIAAVLQLTYIPSLTFQGALRAQLEGVRVKRSYRGKGYGRRLVAEAIRQAEQRGAGIIQLTTNKIRQEAIQFYTKLGFEDSHLGLKMYLK